MNALTIMDFISKHGEETASLFPLGKSEAFIQKLLDAGQILFKYSKGKLIGICTYYRTPTEEMGRIYTHNWELPSIYNKGPYLFVDQVVVHPKYRHKNILNQFIKKLNYLNPPIKYGMWSDEYGKWHKQDKEYSMKTNCGIVAFDKISGMLNGRSNVISLATLAQIAQDNEFLLYPMKVKAEELEQLQTPYILHSDFHFETITDHMDLLGIPLEDEVYVLTMTPDVGEMVDAEEAKKVRGSKKAMRWIAPIGLGILGSLVAPGIGTWLGSTVGGGLGAAIGAGSSVLGGAIPTALGAGLGTAAGNALTGKPNWGGAAIAGGAAGLGTALGSLASGTTGKVAPVGETSTGFNVGGTNAAGKAMTYPATASTASVPIGGAVGGTASYTPSLMSSIGAGMLNNPLVQSAQNLGNSIKGAFSPATATAPTVGGNTMASGLGQTLMSGVKQGGAGNLVTTGNAAIAPVTSAVVGSSGLGNLATKGIGALGPQGLLGAGMLGYNMLRKSPSIDTSAYDDYLKQMQMMYSSGGSSPYAQMAIPELKRGIGAGVEGIFPSRDSKWYASNVALKQAELGDAEKRLGDQFALYGRVNSPEHIQSLMDLRQEMGREMDMLKAQMEETDRGQNISGMQNYLQLAMTGDQNAFAALAQAMGSVADAKAAMDAYSKGFQESRLGTIGNLGSTLIANQFNPMNKLLASIGSRGF